MAHQALFAELVYDERGTLVETAVIGGEAQYVVDDDGFHRHIDAEHVDRQVLAFFIGQLQANKDMAVEQIMRMTGQDDLFTKAAIDAQIENVNMDEIMKQGVPLQARNMLGMMGFRIIINVHGDVVDMDQPALPDEEL